MFTCRRRAGTGKAAARLGRRRWPRHASYTAVLKVRGNVVEDLGIADNALTRTRSAQNVLMHSFY